MPRAVLPCVGKTQRRVTKSLASLSYGMKYLDLRGFLEIRQSSRLVCRYCIQLSPRTARASPSNHLSVKISKMQSTSTAPSPRWPPVPHVYNSSSGKWTPLSDSSSADTTADNTAPLSRNALLRVISWNIDFSIPAHYDRTTTALNYLSALMTPSATAAADTKTPSPDTAPILLMFQEMTAESHAAILFHPWIRAHFAISEKAPLLQRYYTLLLVDRRLSTRNWFRVPFKGSRYRRDVVGVDVMVKDSSSEGEGEEIVTNEERQCVRFCTTHLESLGEPPGFELRPKQLAVISGLLKEQGAVKVVGGLVGGDMNAISEVDNVSHKKPDVDLRDVWEDNVESFEPAGLDALNRDRGLTLGRAEGHTWGYQARGRWPPKRFDKFFYTGDLEMEALEEVKDTSGKVGRLGVDLRTEDDDWVSDHFGISIGLKVCRRVKIF